MKTFTQHLRNIYATFTLLFVTQGHTKHATNENASFIARAFRSFVFPSTETFVSKRFAAAAAAATVNW